MKLLRKWFCRHQYRKVGFREERDNEKRFYRFANKYRCAKCGKVIWTDIVDYSMDE